MTDKAMSEAERVVNELKQFCIFKDSYHESLAITSVESTLQAEREACARVAENTSSLRQDGRPNLTVGYEIAEAIRKRGFKEALEKCEKPAKKPNIVIAKEEP